MATIKPIGDRIVIRQEMHEEVTQGGIFIPETAAEKPAVGEVIAVGPGNYGENGERQPLMINVGDVVTFAKPAAVEIEVEKEKLLAIREHDVIAIIR